jgi:hypothetical protein
LALVLAAGVGIVLLAVHDTGRFQLDFIPS